MSQKFSKKWTILFFIAYLCLPLAAAGYKLHQYALRNQKGILLAFDDTSTESWEDNFDLFDAYHVKVTFFISTAEILDFFDKALARGHEIGFHTRYHINLTENPDMLYAEAIEPLEAFRAAGYNITSFAYPYGTYEEWMNVELLKYYNTLRGAWYYRGVAKEALKKGFIESYSIDNLHFASDEEFRAAIVKMLDGLYECGDGTVVSIFSHAIGDGSWCISRERLIILFEEAQKRNFKFYTFQELQ